MTILPIDELKSWLFEVFPDDHIYLMRRAASSLEPHRDKRDPAAAVMLLRSVINVCVNAGPDVKLSFFLCSEKLQSVQVQNPYDRYDSTWLDNIDNNQSEINHLTPEIRARGARESLKEDTFARAYVSSCEIVDVEGLEAGAFQPGANPSSDTTFQPHPPTF